eukprot:3874051-Pyramimonas_sp.AAC.1
MVKRPWQVWKSVLGDIDDIIVERLVAALAGICCNRRFAAHRGLDDASPLPLLAAEMAGIKVGAAQA